MIVPSKRTTEDRHRIEAISKVSPSKISEISDESLRDVDDSSVGNEYRSAPNTDMRLGRPGSLTIKEWLTTDEAADYLGLSVGALRNMTSNGHVPYHKLGRRNRYRLTDLRELLLSHKRGGFRGN